nr:MAG TPA: MAEBL protein [Caudoviricetes sp.]
MKHDDGTLSFGTAIDTSDFDAGIERIEGKVSELTSNVEVETSKISQLLTNVPTLNIDVVSNASQSLSTIETAFAEIDRVRDLNAQGIRELEAEYQRLGQQGAAAFNKATKAGDDEFRACQRQQQAIQQVINARKRAISEANKQFDSLVKLEQQMKKEAVAAEKAANSQVSIRTRLRQLREELVMMEAAGQRGTAQYKVLQDEAGKLTDAWADATAQANILAHDQRGMQGLISGISGVAGAFSVAQGTMSLFAGENEDLQKIMVKVQSLMAITIGLQQIQQTLNKDSAFTLVTLNGLKEWWNNLLAVGIGEQTAETAATAANTAAQGANTAATIADTAAQAANNAATNAGTAATGANTAGQIINTGAAKAGTIANIGLAGAFRMVGAAIKSIPVFGWILAAIGALIGVISHFIGKSKEADKEFEEQQEILKAGREAYAKASMEISSYQTKLEKFNGTKEQEKQLVKELNSKYGEHMGYYKTLAEWKSVLKQKGQKYCEMLLLEAQAQAVLNKYTESYINLLEVQDKAKKGDFDKWYRGKRGDARARQKAIKEAQDETDKWEAQYKDLQNRVQQIKDDNDLNFHIDPSAKGKTFDPKKAALDQKKAVEEWKNAVKKYLKDAQNEIADYTLDAMAEGQAKELNQIELNTVRKRNAWRDQLRQLAEVRKKAEKEYYLSHKGATEVGWANSERGKMSTEDYMKQLLSDPKIAEQFNRVLTEITEQGERDKAAVRQKYTDALIDEYGTVEQRLEKLNREWTKKLSLIPTEYVNNAIKQMNAEFAALESADFKKSINWESVFGDLGKQSLSTLQYNLDKIKSYFASNKDSMGATEIKDYQEAITKMEDEIASRNPFVALHKSIKDIESAKNEYVAALQEWRDAQEAITTAQQEYNDALTIEQGLREQINLGQLAADSEEYLEAEERLKQAKNGVATATDRSNQAEQKALNARNNITVAYKSFATQLRSVGGVVSDIGGKAKNLASIFSDDVAMGIGKALDTIDAVLDATATVIDAIGDTGKSVAEAMTTTAQASGTAMQSTAQAAATSISTVEKASVILAVISAALQVATAIANLFNDDEEKQKEIENLQRRIDQLQWELDNADAVRLQNNVGDAVQRLRDIYAETTQEVLRLHLTSQQYGNVWTRMFARMRYDNEVYEKSIEKIADAYAKVAYTADKALGGNKYDEGRKQLENLAEQQILIQKQINEEQSKKKTDHGKIEEWRRQIQEIAEQMATIINEMLEDIIGYTAADLASELGNAFFEAAKQGEDAMEAWHKKVNDIVADVLRRMLVQKYLEERIGGLFDKYKKEWFGNDGQFKGIDAVIGSMNGFANDLNNVGEEFNAIYQGLSESLRDYFSAETEREGTSKGIATASQDSVDENNARLTTIQGHTYTLVQGMADLNRTGNAVLDKLAGIEKNTSDTNIKLDNMGKNVKDIKDTVDDISSRGIKIKP